MRRGSALSPISARRRAQFAALGINSPTSTFLPKKAVSTRPVAAPSRAVRRSTGPDKLTVETVWARDGGRCAWCGDPITGERGWDWSVSHRRPRRAGGDPRPETNGTANLVLLHGHGTSLCHGRVERERTKALAAGHLLHDGDMPSSKPIQHAVFGRVWLSDDGGVSARPPGRAA